MFQFSTNVPISRKFQGRWTERQTDRLYFIGPLLLLSGVQKLKPQVFTQPPQQKHIYIYPPPLYVKKKIKIAPLLCLSFLNSLSSSSLSFLFALHLNPQKYLPTFLLFWSVISHPPKTIQKRTFTKLRPLLRE